MKSYELIIFDWDGTLMDSAARIIRCMQQAAKDCNANVPSADAVSHIIGISLKPAIKLLFGLGENIEADALADNLVQAYKSAYLRAENTPCPLFEGVEQLLSDLHQKKHVLAVATGKARRGLNRAWQQTNTGCYFSASRCADEAESKPSPDMLLQLLDERGLHAKQAIMIGDTTYDMQMAETIGMDRIGVSYGVHAQVDLQKHQPMAIVHSVTELHTLLSTLLN